MTDIELTRLQTNGASLIVCDSNASHDHWRDRYPWADVNPEEPVYEYGECPVCLSLPGCGFPTKGVYRLGMHQPGDGMCGWWMWA